jgi:hypothetical protein
MALREVRNAMRAGFGLMRDTIDRAPLPTPVAAVAGSVLREVDQLAHQADATASTVLRGLFTAAGIEVDDRAARRVAALSTALGGVLRELGQPELRVSEAGIRAALAASDGAGDAPSRAAALMRGLIEAGALRPAPGAAAPDPAVPVFAAVLADLQEIAADRAGIAASAALATALAGEIDAAGPDREALARLFAEFRGHV